MILGAAGHGDDLALDQLKPGLAVAGVEEGEEALEGNPCLDRERAAFTAPKQLLVTIGHSSGHE